MLIWRHDNKKITTRKNTEKRQKNKNYTEHHWSIGKFQAVDIVSIIVFKMERDIEKILEEIQGEKIYNLMKNVNPEIQKPITPGIRIWRKLHQGIYHNQIAKTTNKKKILKVAKRKKQDDSQYRGGKDKNDCTFLLRNSAR